MSEQETQAVEPQESQPADDAELQETQAVQEAGLEGATQAADADAAAPTVIAVAHLHAAQALPEVGPDADVVPGCVYEGIELFKAEDRRTMRVVLVRDLGLAAQEVPEQPAEEA